MNIRCGASERDSKPGECVLNARLFDFIDGDTNSSNQDEPMDVEVFPLDLDSLPAGPTVFLRREGGVGADR